MTMRDETYERLLDFLATDDELAAGLDEDLVDSMVAETASLLSDLRVAADDLAGAAAWRQVAVDSGDPVPSGSLDGSPELCFDLPFEDEHHLGSSSSWQDRAGE
ncbi:hypothetical protein [Lentzea sp. CA-135723]|uniref:hypothetical protein n=1 Tax=Lentzea sp. CA-135723 TaxID=3239950 RepID=UPI003D9161BB